MLIFQNLIMILGSSYLGVSLYEGLPDLMVLNDTSAIDEYFHRLGISGRTFYIYAALYDCVYCLAYGALGSILIVFLSFKFSAKKTIQIGTLLFFIAPVMDIAENISLIRVATVYPQEAPMFALASTIFTNIKFSCICLGVMYILTLMWLSRLKKSS